MPLYRIKDWNENYETHRTRDLAQMKWVPIPNKMDGIGYTELIEHPNGAAHFGAWIAIIEIASRQDPRGTLPIVRGSTCIALSRLSRIPVQVFEEVMPRLLAEEIGWIEEVAAEDRANAAQTSRSVAQDGEKPALYNSTVQDIEEKGIQGTENTARAPEPVLMAKASEPTTPGTPSSEGKNKRADKLAEQKKPFLEEFDRVWKVCWSSRGKLDAQEAYVQARMKGVSYEKIITAVQDQAPGILAESDKRHGTPVYLSTWINKGRYDDDPQLQLANGSRASPAPADEDWSCLDEEPKGARKQHG